MVAGATATDAIPALFSTEDFYTRVRARLTLDLPDLSDMERPWPGGDHRVGGFVPNLATPPRLASVLIPVVARGPEPTVLLTVRASHLRVHSGQIALPGGKIDPDDLSPADAALREAWEEVGLARDIIRPLGYLDPYLTGTGFLVVPTLASVQPGFELRLNHDEVDEAFEVPLGFLMQAGNHGLGSRDINGHTRTFYTMVYLERTIWGVTAGILRSLYDRLYG